MCSYIRSKDIEIGSPKWTGSIERLWFLISVPCVICPYLDRIVSETQWSRYWLKIATFWYPTFISAPVGVTPSEFHSLVSCGKTRIMGPPGDEKRLMVSLSLAVSTQYTNVMDRSDGQTRRRQEGPSRRLVYLYIDSKPKPNLHVYSLTHCMFYEAIK